MVCSTLSWSRILQVKGYLMLPAEKGNNEGTVVMMVIDGAGDGDAVVVLTTVIAMVGDGDGDGEDVMVNLFSCTCQLVCLRRSAAQHRTLQISSVNFACQIQGRIFWYLFPTQNFVGNRSLCPQHRFYPQTYDHHHQLSPITSSCAKEQISTITIVTITNNIITTSHNTSTKITISSTSPSPSPSATAAALIQASPLTYNHHSHHSSPNSSPNPPPSASPSPSP